MPLAEMSPNIQEPDGSPRKRSHDEFSSDGDEKATTKQLESMAPDSSTVTGSPKTSTSTPKITPASPKTSSSAMSSPDSTQKSDANDTTASTIEPGGTVPTASNDATSQPAKRKRLTQAEKDAREKEAAEKKKDREEKAAVKAAEAARQEEEKAARLKEREEKRKKKAEEDKVKAEKAHEREEKKRKLQEEKEKQERKQPKLNSFFGIPSSHRAKPEDATKGSPQKNSPVVPITKATQSEYRRVFQPFFKRKDTRLATALPMMDEEAREVKSAILDDFLCGKRSHDPSNRPFDAVEVFTLPCKPRKRGKLHPPVKQIMETAYKESGGSTDQAAHAIEHAKEKLQTIPMKIICFSQDVRPPYYGTITSKPFTSGINDMRMLARKSCGRRLKVDYDYDSEAEWQEDEEGEDLDVDDEDEELDDEDDMEGFLDDSEDAGPSRRLFAQTIEPECSGICFEDQDRKGPNTAMHDYKMEIMIDAVDSLSTINPWSTSYWDPEPKRLATQKQIVDATTMAPPAAPTNAFAALDGTNNAALKTVKTELINDVKRAILVNKGLSKVGMIDFIFQQFRSDASRTEVKNTIELVAERKKVAMSKIKEWDLKPGHEITS